MRYKIGALFAGIALAFSLSACGVEHTTDPAEPESSENADLGASPQVRFTCNGSEPGLPVPLAKEPQFDACMKNYAAQFPNMPSNGKPVCCPQVTKSIPQYPSGCMQCFLQ